MALIILRAFRLIVWSAAFLLALPAWSARRADRVVVVTLDGLHPAAISDRLAREPERLPTFRRLITEGAFTGTARTVLPSVTLPAHVSLLTGLLPAHHRITVNAWVPGERRVSVTTLFQRVKRAGMRTAMVVGKEKLGILAVPGSLDEYRFLPFHNRVERDISAEAIRILVRGGIAFLFVHYPFPDHSGHLVRWLSPSYHAEVERMDKEMGRLVKVLATDPRRTLLILTSDHGGHGRSHGSARPADRTIPWIAWATGGMVRRGYAIRGPVEIQDTAAVVLDALGLSGDGLDGRPISDLWSE